MTTKGVLAGTPDIRARMDAETQAKAAQVVSPEVLSQLEQAELVVVDRAQYQALLRLEQSLTIDPPLESLVRAAQRRQQFEAQTPEVAQ